MELRTSNFDLRSSNFELRTSNSCLAGGSASLSLRLGARRMRPDRRQRLFALTGGSASSRCRAKRRVQEAPYLLSSPRFSFIRVADRRNSVPLRAPSCHGPTATAGCLRLHALRARAAPSPSPRRLAFHARTSAAHAFGHNVPSLSLPPLHSLPSWADHFTAFQRLTLILPPSKCFSASWACSVKSCLTLFIMSSSASSSGML